MAESAAFRAAVEKMQRGDAAGAEALLAAAVRTAREIEGAASPGYARACYEYGSCLGAQGQVRRALGPFRDACAVDPCGDAEATRSRLTYLVQLGELLERAGELEEAEGVLRESLAGRAKLYGEEHAGYGFGLEPLAAVLLRKGALEEAGALCERAVANFAENGHERVATALALRAEIHKATDPASPAFGGIQAPPAFFEALVEAVLAREPAIPAAWSEVLRETHDLVLEHLGADHAAALRSLSALANHEHGRGVEGDPERRQWALARLVEAFDRGGDARQAVMARLGLALALSDAGAQAGSLEVYERARSDAREIGDAGLRAKVLRNLGLLLSSMDRPELAEKRLRAALKLAKEADDGRELQAARVALGIFLQHGGRKDEARGYLRRAADGPDPAHPDALCARSHLEAIESGSACGCGDMTRSMAVALERLVRAELTDADLLDRLSVDVSDDGVKIGVHLTREPAPDELERLQAAVHRAESALRERIKSGRSISLDLP